MNTRHRGISKTIKPLLPYILTLGLFIFGLWSLYHLLKEVSWLQIRSQVGMVPGPNLLAAIAATALGYAALVGYDWTALRYIGRSLPARTVILGGFLGYAVGNTVGLSALSGGAVRYRVYSALGLGLPEIAKISGFVAVASGVGATMIGLAALAVHPDALRSVLPLHPDMVRIGAITGFVLANALIWYGSFAGLHLGIGRFVMRIPRPTEIASQMLITTVDMLMGAMVLYFLLGPSAIGFVPFLAVYLAAMMAGIISHVPGGVGVFETVVIAALPREVSVTDAAAALLLYRMIYYIAPFLIALLILAVAEGRRLWTGGVSGVGLQIAAGLVPLAMGAVVMAAGALMMLAPMIPAARDIARDAEAALPVGLIEAGALLSSALGAMLVLIAQGLLRRLSGAWWLTMVALATGVGTALLDGYDTERALFLAFVFLLLLPCRRAFYRSTRLTTGALSVSWMLLVGAMLASVVTVFFFANQAGPYADELWWDLAENERAPGPLRAALTGGMVLSLLTIWQALRRTGNQIGMSADDASAAYQAIVSDRNGADDILLPPEARFLFSETGDAGIAYLPEGRVWVVIGDPVGDHTEIPGLIWAFRDAARRTRVDPVYYRASGRWIGEWVETGMMVHPMGTGGEYIVLPRLGDSHALRKAAEAAFTRLAAPTTGA